MPLQITRPLVSRHGPVALIVTFVAALAGCGNGSEHSATGTEPSITALADAAATRDDYPLETCVVSGEDLASMGEHVAIDFEGREVRFCCTACVKDFKKEPAKYLAILDAAAASRPSHSEAGHDQQEHGHDHDHSEHDE